ncbi:MAG TPA: fatty acid desaturase [Verrucomicrobiota bacterium]|nr:fatty acid desaturase [Verrucomicrobiota bacterium]
MSENAHPTYRQTILGRPTYGHPGPAPNTPPLKAVIVEWFDALNFIKDRTRLLPLANALFHFSTFVVFVWFFVAHFSVASVVAVVLVAAFIGTIYNTVWYHRFCSHQAFKFRSIWFARGFLWTNPLFLREECYVIPHRLHHSKSDEPGDPYGPHLRWLGSYLATETVQKMNLNLTAAEYERLAKSLTHTGIVCNSHSQYQRTGSVENLRVYAARVIFAALFWGVLTWALAGWWGVWAWVSGVFLFTFVVRDFNYRGHSALMGTKKQGEPVNQFIYGLFAGEWHENHHNYPRLARSGLTWWQVDVPYWIVLAMKACGIVTQCNSRVPATVYAPNDAQVVV